MPNQGQPAASFKFNTFQEIKSHSSILFNERLAILFYLLDCRSIEMNTSYSVSKILEVRAIIKQIYNNIRTLIRNNPTVRATLNLETKDEGTYITDVAMGSVDRMIEYCDIYGFTTKRVYIIIQELNNIEMIIKDILQYFHYFIRPDFRQKPDIEIATQKYKEIADQRTVDELREIVGSKNKIDFEGLGTSRVELQQEIEYEPEVEEQIDEELENKEEQENNNEISKL